MTSKIKLTETAEVCILTIENWRTVKLLAELVMVAYTNGLKMKCDEGPGWLSKKKKSA